jgi:signal peptidase II
MRHKYILFAVVLVLGLICDQLSKALVRSQQALDDGGVVVIPGLLRLVHAENPGAALSLLASLPNAVFMIMATASAALVLVWLTHLRPNAWVLPTCLALVLSGAIGNTLDRVVFSTVTDFIVLGEGVPAVLWGLSWFGVHSVPAFNAADALLGGGLVLLAGAILWPGVAQREAGGIDTGTDSE